MLDYTESNSGSKKINRMCFACKKQRWKMKFSKKKHSLFLKNLVMNLFTTDRSHGTVCQLSQELVLRIHKKDLMTVEKILIQTPE